MNKNPFDDIPPHRRQLYFRIAGSDKFSPEMHPITLRLHFLNDAFPLQKLDRALSWLVKNNIVGPQFLKWFQTQCGNSDLEMHRKLLLIVDNEMPAKIIAGKNFRI